MVKVSSKRWRRGKLKPGAFFQLNFDVLFLIAEYIHPKDLLSLSRTCKSLREFLMDKSSAFVWKTARQQVDGMPDCPADLTEQEYADLVFCARCHGCGKPVRTVLWYIRRRYCADCKLEWLIDISSCNKIIRNNEVLASEELTIQKETKMWVDIGQIELFLDEYHQSSDKKQFLDDREKQYSAIYQHAFKCESWQNELERKRRKNLALRRQERHERIFERLKQHGYGPEIEHLGQPRVRDSYKPIFRTSKLLTDREWDHRWPEWVTIMDEFRAQRLEEVVYQPRRHSLATEYKTYVTHPSPDAPAFDLLPHLADVRPFPPFQDIIRAPEGPQMNDKPFASAFAQLPALVTEWRKKLDAKIAARVKIPSGLSSGEIVVDRAVASSSTTSTGSSQMNTDKLNLACALFSAGNGTFTHPEVFSLSMRDHYLPNNAEADSERTGSIEDRFSINFVKEAPYIVYACGLDPNVATADDMDRRNARLRCLCRDRDSRNIVMNWRNAMWHTSTPCYDFNFDDDDEDEDVPVISHSNGLCWQLVNDEHIYAIQAAEQSVEKLPAKYMRCLLCLPSVGDALSQWHSEFVDHSIRCHNIEKEEIKQGVHYMPLGICDSLPVVKMVEEGEQVTFRVSQQHYDRLRNVLTGTAPARWWK